MLYIHTHIYVCVYILAAKEDKASDFLLYSYFKHKEKQKLNMCQKKVKIYQRYIKIFPTFLYQFSEVLLDEK